MAAFEYSAAPLGDPVDASIRVIDLLPGVGKTMISLRLRSIGLYSAAPYEALSYCWSGGPNANDPVEILCCDRPLVINRSLNDALCHLRHSDRPRTIWADAICINQKDDDEKTTQVLLMGAIYRKAASVVIWLGNDWISINGGAKIAFGLIPLLGKAFKEKFKGPPKDILAIASQVPGVEKLPNDNFNYDAWDAFVELLSQPWFGRAWIIQECSVAVEATVLCGECSASWADFICALAYFTSTPTLKTIYSVGSIPFKRATALLLAYCAYKTEQGQTLLKLLIQHRPCDATDPKDKVFALCGIAKDCGPEALDFKPDYHLDLTQVYTEAAIAILRKASNLDLLAVPRVSSATSTLRVPSWVPDWSTCDLAETFCEDVYRFQASKQSTSAAHIIMFPNSTNVSVRVISCGATPTAAPFPTGLLQKWSTMKLTGILGISGFTLDTITEVGVVWDVDPTSNPFITVPTAQVIYNSWEAIARARSKTTYLTGEPILDAYYRCLQAGNPVEEFDATTSQREQMDRQSQRFRRLHNWNLHKHKKSYLAASWGVMMYNQLSDVYRERESGAMAPGLRLTRVPHRRMFRTSKGYIGIGPRNMVVGDAVTLCKGSRVPLILRDKEFWWELVGDAYVHGVMTGEAFNEDSCGTMWII